LPLGTLQQFLKLEAAGGIVLCAAAALALLLANSPLSAVYEQLLELPVAIQIGGPVIAKPLLLCVNDGLMAIFFMLVGLEIKRELVEGELSSVSKAALPAIAAFGGMAVPAIVYMLLPGAIPRPCAAGQSLSTSRACRTEAPTSWSACSSGSAC
jgi:NhaA family Na+:H+ antiporter